jgi:hypothetical protein
MAILATHLLAETVMLVSLVANNGRLDFSLCLGACWAPVWIVRRISIRPTQRRHDFYVK